MPEMLGDGGVLFDPENVESIAAAVLTLVKDPELRMRASRAARDRASQYSWARCAEETFSFLARMTALHNNSASVL